MRTFNGTRLRQIRKDRGLSRERFAAASGFSVRAVEKWETGYANPQANTLVRLADFLGIPMDDLFATEETTA